MLASQLIGPVAQEYHHQLQIEGAHERRLSRAEGDSHSAAMRGIRTPLVSVAWALVTFSTLIVALLRGRP